MISPDVRNIALDLDDTIVKTREIFRAKMNEVYGVLGMAMIGFSREAIKEEFERINNSAFWTHYVNPNRWDAVMEQFCGQHPQVTSGVRRSCREILASIYGQVPEFKDGARKALEGLKNRGYALGLVTHAEKKWTDFKLERLSLTETFGQGVCSEHERTEGQATVEKRIGKV